MSCRWREQHTVDSILYTAVHMLSQRGSQDWAQSCVWSLCWQNEATSSMQLTWKLFIPKTPWCHQSGMDEPWPLTSLLETNNQTSKQQQQLHIKRPRDKYPCLFFAVPCDEESNSTKQNKTWGKHKTLLPRKQKGPYPTTANKLFQLAHFLKRHSTYRPRITAYESLCGDFH